MEPPWNDPCPHQRLQHAVEVLDLSLIHPAEVVKVVELLALLVQAPFHLPEIRPQVGFGPLQLANQALQLSLREIVPVQREGVGQWLQFLVLNLDLYLQMISNTVFYCSEAIL